MLLPKRIKHRKHQRGRMQGLTKGGSEVAFGEFGLKALEPGWVNNRQIEAARVAMTRYIKRGGNVFLLQKSLGHSSLDMSRKYAQLTTEDLSAVHSKISLLAD